MNPNALRGHLDAMVMATLEDRPLHGYAIMEALRERSAGAVDLPTGTLYPALRRMERAGYLRSAWSTVNGRRRRTYELTSVGGRALAAERSDWRDFSTAIEGVLRPGTASA